MSKKTYREIQSSWYIKTKAGHLYRKISGQIATAHDIALDKKICGCSLAKYEESIDREVKQSTGSESTRYYALDEVFDGYNFSKDEKIIDVGCGKGRVLAYLKHKGFEGQLVGIEHNPKVAEYAQKWTEKYDNITIISGDAFDLNCDDYTVFYFNRPFIGDMYEKFIEKMEKELTHPVTVFTYVDTRITPYLKQRQDHWRIERRDYVFKKGALAYSYYPNRYAIWTYIPN